LFSGKKTVQVWLGFICPATITAVDFSRPNGS